MFSNELLKKGVPVNLPFPVELFVTDLMMICKNTKNIKEQIKVAGEKFYNLISEKCGDETADFLCVRNFVCVEVYIDASTLERKLIVSPLNLFNRIAQLTEENSISYYDFEAINKAINKLKNISEEEFKNNYTELYNYYSFVKNEMSSLVLMKSNFKKMNQQNISIRIDMLAKMHGCNYNTMKSKIESATLNYNYKQFLEKFIKILKNVYNLSEQLLSPSIKEGNDIYSNINIEIDPADSEKLGIYITYLYQDMLKKVEKEYQQLYLYYISEYYFENKELIEQNKKIYLPRSDKIIKLKDMYEDYKQILVDNPALRIVDFTNDDFSNMNLEEVNEFMDEYLKSLNANWDFFKDSTIDEETIEKIKRYYGDLSKFPNQDELKSNLSKFIEKKEFFDRTDPYYRILGKNTFDGYIGYIYSNGIVVLEKFFENSATGKVAKNQAIYSMKIQDFYSLTQLSKNEIILKKLCKRFIHKGNWQEKVENEINQTQPSTPIDIITGLKQSGKIK